MIIYEVNLKIDNAIVEDYNQWLVAHIEEILQIEGFESAEWLEVESDDTDHVSYSIQYHLTDRGSLENYFQNHAARLRQDGLERFEGQFTATRRILKKI